MIRTSLFKLGVLLACAVLLCAQEQPALPKNSIPMQEVPAVAPPSVDAPKEDELKQQEAIAVDNNIQNQPNEQRQVVPQAVQPLQTAQDAQQNQQPVQDSPAAEAVQPEVPETEAQTPNSNQGGLQNLTEQQKKQLLHEESIRAQLHSNSELKLSDLANMTVQQQQQMERRFAEESRAAYQRAKREMDERQAKEAQQIQKLLKQAKLTRTEEIKMREQQKITVLQNKQKNSMVKLSSDYLFDMDPNTEEDFLISLPVAQKIGFLISIYSNENGVYVRNKDVDSEKPLSLTVYENNRNTVYQSSFYFNDAYMFDGNADSTYTVRFENADMHRLVSLRTTTVLERSQIQSKLKAADLVSHSARSRQLYNVTKEKLFGFKQKAVLVTSNRMKLSQEIKTYYLYHCVEMLIFIGTVLVQIEMIRRLLGSSSIV